MRRRVDEDDRPRRPDHADFVDIGDTNGALDGSYFCDWSLKVGPAGNATILFRDGPEVLAQHTDANDGCDEVDVARHDVHLQDRRREERPALRSTISADYVDDTSKTGCTP